MRSILCRVSGGLLKPKNQILGCEFAGVVEETGPAVTTFKKGDRVFGFNDKTFGGHAEYLTISETGAIAQMPATMHFDAAAAITEGAHYALVDIRAAKVKPVNARWCMALREPSVRRQCLYWNISAQGQQRLVIKNVTLIKSFGADEVIDYQTQDFTQTGNRYEFIFDAVGKSSLGSATPLTEKEFTSLPNWVKWREYFLCAKARPWEG